MPGDEEQVDENEADKPCALRAVCASTAQLKPVNQSILKLLRTQERIWRSWREQWSGDEGANGLRGRPSRRVSPSCL